MKTYVEVIINSDALDIDRLFTYEVKDELKEKIRVGQLIKVPFGIKNNSVDGFILSINNCSPEAGIRIKKIKSITSEEPVLNEKNLKLVEFLRNNYLCKYIDAIRLLIPYGVLKGTKNKVKKVIVFIKNPEDTNIQKKYDDIIKFIKNNNGVYTKAELNKVHGISLYKINKLIEYGYISSQAEIIYRYNDKEYKIFEKNNLTDEQINAIQEIINDDKNVILLKGVTGSGKTEVYMELVQYEVTKGKSAVVLVPEIALTPQMIERFKGRFGKNVAVFHSRLSDGERFDEWYRVKEGKAKVIIGARSALFLPVNDLGIIIIDEEHENTYKSEQNPKYQTKEVAEFLGQINNCKVVLGSATPSIENYYRGLTGEIGLVELKNRIDMRPMPKIEIADMREELQVGNVSLFSRKLFFYIKEALSKKEQVILFLNRRGFASFVSCRACGYVFKCSVCDISMTYHKNGFLVCHYCGKTEKQPKICPKCSSKYVKHFGAGTQRVEEEVRKYFKEARVLRMDVDTTRNKNSYENIYNTFKSGNADILIGTQMIAKGLDFPNVTLVGVLAADMSINIPDYRSCEKTFQLITQVAGRAGRGEKEGKVVVQTYTPNHYSLKYAQNYDYEGFYNEEFTVRGLMGYPPFGKLLLINIACINEEKLKKFIYSLANILQKINDEYSGIDMLGPVPCIISKIRDSYRWQILFKGELSLDFCIKVKKVLYDFNKNVYNDIRVSIDINPNNLV